MHKHTIYSGYQIIYIYSIAGLYVVLYRLVLQFQSFSAHTSAYPFRYHPISPTLPDNHPIFSFYSYTILSFPPFPISPYRSISFQTLVLLIAYPEAHYADSLSFFCSYPFPHFRLHPCKDNHFVFKPLVSRCIL